MLYLEDFIESIEQLPAEMKEKFTKLRCLDLEAQNDQDRNQERIKNLFDSAVNISSQDRNNKYKDIKSSFNKILKCTDDKVDVSNSMSDLIERYQRQLDAEIAKFKMELEADSPGITEQIEKRALESQIAHRNSRKNEKKRKQRSMTKGDGTMNGEHSPSPSLNHANLNLMLADNNPSGSRHSDPLRSAAGGSSSQSSYLHFANNESRHGRPRKMTSRVQELLQGALTNKEKRERASTSSSGMWLPNQDNDAMNSSTDSHVHEDDAKDAEAEGERTWCICNQSSYGEMVACDNPSCAFEWFHYECVNISAPPKGRWFCPHCAASIKRRKLEGAS